ncbi:2-dehydro-3-deoxygalactonokinase [Novosphingobium sp.]|uniref:2-dehydro-3-deoxygalactonokinase n=1 Tax=Novosphingobium sp. TaxID=1874826 RepID=UPI00262CC73B|nr:2-dehydro-3-deoxygalactonokinase [Novosphingobium sp.]
MTGTIAPTTPFLLVDWGTTNRRVYRVSGDDWAQVQADGQGASGTYDYPGELAGLRRRHGDLPALLVGMVGSTIGWTPVPYVPAPASLPDLAVALQAVAERAWIVPGVSWQDPSRADVMRGEELQLLGAVEAGLIPRDALVCQPGTHCKWARLAEGRLVAFVTSMTGELFALLRGHSLLAGQLRGETTPGAAFLQGVREGARRDLAASLFGIRAHAVLGRDGADDAASFASGVLIGADVQARLAELHRQPVHLVADRALGGLYAAAIEELGHSSIRIASDRALVAGARALWSVMHDQ